MRNEYLLTVILVCCVSFVGASQSYDEKIASAMNSADWFELELLYNEAPKDSVMSFLEIYSRCLIGNRLNRPDISIPAFEELLNTQSGYLDINNLTASALMFGMDLSRVGKNESAAALINSVVDAAKQYFDSATVASMKRKSGLYSALAMYTPYEIEYPVNSEVMTVPFRIVPVGPADKGSVHMHISGSINGRDADMTFDTGAGVNIISDSMAVRLGLEPIGAEIDVQGIETRNGYFAMARELIIGDITVHDVPFCVVSLTTGNEEADQYFGSFDIVLGSELMLQLKDLTIDFVNRTITVPVSAPERIGVNPNMCFSSTMNLLVKGTVLGNEMLMCMDSGDAGFGSLGLKFFENNKEYVTTHAVLDSVREAGIGGVRVSPCYNATGVPVEIGDNVVVPERLTVKTAENMMSSGYECNIGIKTMMLFGKIRFNMVDFVVTTYPDGNVVTKADHDAPIIKFTGDEGRSWLQNAGCVIMSVANGLLNDNAPNFPDL